MLINRFTILLWFCVAPLVNAHSASFTTIYGFTSSSAGYIPRGVIVGTDGTLYGVTQLGGFTSGNCSGGCGVVFSLAPPSSGNTWTETVLWTFGMSASDGQVPVSLVMGSNGVLYGTTQAGGLGLAGTVFSLAPPQTLGGTWTETVLWTFGRAGDGKAPLAGLVIDDNGVIYGTTSQGGRFHHGIAFSLSPPSAPGGAWTEKRMWSFGNSGDGKIPNSALAIDHAGTLYGTTSGGGANTYGTVYLLTLAKTGAHWRELVLQSFTQQSGRPKGVAIRDGVLYGGTSPVKLSGGNHSGGIAYSLSPPATAGTAWTMAILATFPHRLESGHDLNSPLIVTIDGDLLGTTNRDGAGPAGGYGTLFKVSPPATPGGNWTYKALQSLGALLSSPVYNGLAEGTAGTFFGTCSSCGGNGTVFSFQR